VIHATIFDTSKFADSLVKSFDLVFLLHRSVFRPRITVSKAFD